MDTITRFEADSNYTRIHRTSGKPTGMNMFGGTMEKLTGAVGTPIGKRVEEALGKVKLPPFRSEWNYQPMEKRIELVPFIYPLVLNDPTILDNDSIMRVEHRNADGVFDNKALYRKEPGFYQHKPYNYYVAILKQYFPKDFGELEVKVLPENL